MLDSKARGWLQFPLSRGHEEETESWRHSQSGVGRVCSLRAGTQDGHTKAHAGKAERTCDLKSEKPKSYIIDGV